jgi:hypothetical protein
MACLSQPGNGTGKHRVKYKSRDDVGNWLAGDVRNVFTRSPIAMTSFRSSRAYTLGFNPSSLKMTNKRGYL